MCIYMYIYVYTFILFHVLSKCPLARRPPAPVAAHRGLVSACHLPPHGPMTPLAHGPWPHIYTYIHICIHGMIQWSQWIQWIHHWSSLIVTDHHSSSVITTHHRSSSLLVTDHESSSVIMNHHNKSCLGHILDELGARMGRVWDDFQMIFLRFSDDF